MDYIQKINDTDAPEGRLKKSEPALRIIDTDLETLKSQVPLQTNTTVKRRLLVNKLNHLNFTGRTVSIHFQHVRNKQLITFEGIPQPCFDKYLICLWKDPPNVQQLHINYQFLDFVFDDAQTIITVEAIIKSISERGVCFILPEKSSQTTARKAQRFACEHLAVQVIQNSILFSGKLVGFSPISLQIEIDYTPDTPFQCLNLKDRVNLVVRSDQELLYSGECSILKVLGASKKKTIILTPLHESIQRFNPRVYRSQRLRLTPSPDIQFLHPFTGKLISLKVIDLSGSGLSVEDDEATSVLLPGMMIPSMTLSFANSFHYPCKAQVVYRKTFEADTGKRSVQCGIAFLDMNPADHIRLLSLLHQTNNQNFYICNDINMDDLWNFFFKSGFIYPKKYAFMREYKKKITATYAKLYTRDSSIARHFTWQKKGEILGHMSMLRFYQNTWLIQHLAAIMSRDHLKVGIEILNQIAAYAYDSHRLFSSHMDYLICYFRPENHFPNHFFGGVAKNINNPKACSIDRMAYLHYKSGKTYAPLPENWKLAKSERGDFDSLENFYDHQSGGLMLEALDLIPDMELSDRHDLASEYAKNQMKRERRIYSLFDDGLIKAIFMLNISDFAVNMSDLTNCVNVLIMDSDNLPPDILMSAISELSEKFTEKKFPVLLFPAAYADKHGLKYEKSYNLWSLSMQHTDDYFKNFNYLI